MTERPGQNAPRPSGPEPSWYVGAASGSDGAAPRGFSPDGAAPNGSTAYGSTPYGSTPHGPSPYGASAAQAGPGRPLPGYSPVPGAHPGYGMPVAPVGNPGTGLSVASMIVGILSLVGGFGLVFPPVVGIVLGHLGRRREPYGRGMALAGLSMNYLALALVLLLLVGLVLLVALGLSAGDLGGGPATPGLRA